MARVVDRIVEHRRIARTVAQEHAVGLRRDQLGSRRGRRIDAHFAAVRVEPALRIDVPVIAELEFLNAEHTKAAARVVMGHQGGTIVLDKQQGIWTAKASVNKWIS